MAGRIKGITVEIGGDTSGLEKSLNDVNNSIKKTQSQLRDVNNLLKLDPSNTILLAQKQELLQSAIGDTEKKLEALEQAQEDVAKAFERGDLGKDQYMAFQREVEETRDTLNRYKADLSGLQSEQERLSANTERLNKLFAVTGSSVDDYADVLGSRLVAAIKAACPGCAVTLSVGERSRESYQKLFDAGADRYLLRHETATKAHYGRLHPPELSFERRMRCLADLKAIGYQVGCGFMVGSPWQTPADIARDLAFIRRFEPEMVGIGPFIPHRDTPLGAFPAGTVEMTCKLLAIIRLLLPDVLLPATTALATLDPRGCEKGMLAGANVVMPNLSPPDAREKYALYEGKACAAGETADALSDLQKRMENIGYRVTIARGDHRILPTGKQR